MSKISKKLQASTRRRHRVRSRIKDSTGRLRLSVNISNKHISAQIIDDSVGNTLIHVTTVGKGNSDENLTSRATWVGTEVARMAKAAKITKIVFDRSDKKYHGRVKALADAARSEGLEF